MFVKNCRTWVGNLEGRGEMPSDTNPTGVQGVETETKQQKIEAVAVASSFA